MKNYNINCLESSKRTSWNTYHWLARGSDGIKSIGLWWGRNWHTAIRGQCKNKLDIFIKKYFYRTIYLPFGHAI